MQYTTNPAKKQALTLADIAKMDKEFLVPAQVSQILRCAPYHINLMSKTEKGRQSLGFPVMRVKSRVKIPRRAFLEYMGWKEAAEE